VARRLLSRVEATRPNVSVSDRRTAERGASSARDDERRAGVGVPAAEAGRCADGDLGRDGRAVEGVLRAWAAADEVLLRGRSGGVRSARRVLRVEQTLLEGGRGPAVIQQRVEFQELMRGSFEGVIERATGGRVIGFMSGNQQHPDMMCEIIIVAPTDLADLDEIGRAPSLARRLADVPAGVQGAVSQF
jgi:hypothetical protein